MMLIREYFLPDQSGIMVSEGAKITVGKKIAEGDFVNPVFYRGSFEIFTDDFIHISDVYGILGWNPQSSTRKINPMITGAIWTKTIVQVTFTFVTACLFIKVLRAPRKKEPDPVAGE
jgi:hypothetical protein